MIERGEHLRLAFEPGEAVGVGREEVRQDLDGDVTVQLRVARLVNLAHAAGPDGRQHFIRAEASAGSKGHADADELTTLR
jgi:hypothetical protein